MTDRLMAHDTRICPYVRRSPLLLIVVDLDGARSRLELE